MEPSPEADDDEVLLADVECSAEVEVSRLNASTEEDEEEAKEEKEEVLDNTEELVIGYPEIEGDVVKDVIWLVKELVTPAWPETRELAKVDRVLTFPSVAVTAVLGAVTVTDEPREITLEVAVSEAWFFDSIHS